MSWAERYKQIKDQKTQDKDNSKAQKEKLFVSYQSAVNEFYNRIKNMIQGSGLDLKAKKIKVSKELHPTVLTGDKEEMDSIIISDNDNELHLIPEGISFVGILGRLSIKSYKKIYTFQSLMEKNFKAIKEPYLVLIKDKSDESQLQWGYISINEAGNREIKPLTDKELELILDDAFLS